MSPCPPYDRRPWLRCIRELSAVRWLQYPTRSKLVASVAAPCRKFVGLLTSVAGAKPGYLGLAARIIALVPGTQFNRR